MFTRSLASELGGDGFTCIVVHPGWVQTDMGGASATLTVEESAKGIRGVVENLVPGDNGTFWNYDGEALPW
jgi:NAD(P)-dependent dehydrogenase (short-subunit alcohol dehydrogenase family)